MRTRCMLGAVLAVAALGIATVLAAGTAWTDPVTGIAYMTAMLDIPRGNPHADCDDGCGSSAPVGRFPPNAWGLFDMVGNVWEWTASNYDPGYRGGERRAVHVGDPGERVIRGGSWAQPAVNVRAASRTQRPPGVKTVYEIGFRLARSP